MSRNLSEEPVVVTVNSNGTIDLPLSIIERHGWHAGMLLEVAIDAAGDVVLRRPARDDDAVGGEDIEAAVARFVALVPKVEGPYPTDREVARIVEREAGRRFDEKTSR